MTKSPRRGGRPRKDSVGIVVPLGDKDPIFSQIETARQTAMVGRFTSPERAFTFELIEHVLVCLREAAATPTDGRLRELSEAAAKLVRRRREIQTKDALACELFFLLDALTSPDAGGLEDGLWGPVGEPGFSADHPRNGEYWDSASPEQRIALHIAGAINEVEIGAALLPGSFDRVWRPVTDALEREWRNSKPPSPADPEYRGRWLRRVVKAVFKAIGLDEKGLRFDVRV